MGVCCGVAPPPQHRRHVLPVLLPPPQLGHQTPEPHTGRKRFRGCFATGSSPSAGFIFFNPFYKCLFLSLPKAGGAVPHTHPTDVTPQPPPDTGSFPTTTTYPPPPPRQIFFWGAVGFGRWGVGGRLFSQPGELAPGPGCTVAVTRSKSHGSSQVWLATPPPPPPPRAGPEGGGEGW